MPQDARRQKLEVHGQADGLEALFLKGTMIGIADDLLDRHDEFYGIISQRTVRRTGYQMQGNVARFVLRQLYAAELPDKLQCPLPHRVLLRVQHSGLREHEVGQKGALFHTFQRKADVIHQRDGAFAAEQDALLFCRQRDALGGLHHLRGNVIQHLEELGLQFVLHIVHLGNTVFVDHVPRAAAKPKPVAHENGFPAVRHDHRHRIVIEYLYSLHRRTPPLPCRSFCEKEKGHKNQRDAIAAFPLMLMPDRTVTRTDKFTCLLRLYEPAQKMSMR